MSSFENRRPLAELLADNLSYKLLGRLRRRATREDDFQRIVVPINDVCGLRVISTGRFELTQLDAIRTLITSPEGIGGKSIDRQGTFIDVGANIGLYTMALSKFFKNTIAFEASPLTFKILEVNLALSGAAKAQCFCQGISDQTRQATLFTPANGNLGWASVNADRHAPGTPGSEVTVNLDTLDNLSKKLGFEGSSVSLIKIDVEGHEAEVLRGSTEMLKRYEPVVVFEVLTEAAGKDCTQILADCGYSHFYKFQRSMSSTRGFKGYFKSLMHGLPITFDEIDISKLQHAALVCAVKSS
jgi:FkbM family methyltransferase